MAKGFVRLPQVGEVVDAGALGERTVIRIEYDADGDPHLYLDPAEEGPPAA